MQSTPTPDLFPFSAEPTARVEGDATLSGNEAEAKLKADTDLPVATGRRTTLIEQFIRNRPDSKGAKLLGIADRLKALFVNPLTPEGQARINRNRGLGILGSLLDVFAAIKGDSAGTTALRTELGIQPTGVPSAAPRVGVTPETGVPPPPRNEV
jgi:hypothetical protein